MIVGFFVVCIYGFAVGLGIIVSIFLQTPEKEGGYGFTPKQNAECGWNFNAIDILTAVNVETSSQLCPVGRPRSMSNMRHFPRR